MDRGIAVNEGGGKRKFFIPADLAYGERGNNAIGPNEVLVFTVELLGITEKEVTAEEPVKAEALLPKSLYRNTTLRNKEELRSGVNGLPDFFRNNFPL